MDYISICLHLIATGLIATILRSIFAVYAPPTSTFSISRVAGNVIVQGSHLNPPIPACKGVFGFCYEHVIQKYKKSLPQASSPKHKAT